MNESGPASPRPRSPFIHVARAALILPLLAGSACTNPLWRDESDFGRQVPVERLRRIDTLEIEQYARPSAVDINAGALEQQQAAIRAERTRFAGLAKADLSIEDARLSALANNLDLKVQLVNPVIAAENVNVEESRFESVFTTSALYQNFDQPTASTLLSAQQKTTSVTPGVTIPLRSGGTATVALPWQKNETNNIFSTLNPSYISDLQFSISQPLLRNAGREVNTAQIKIANYNRQITETQTKLAIINQLAAVDRGYWGLYQAQRSLEVSQQQYELADEQLKRAERQARAGRVAEIEVIRAQSGVAQRLGAIIAAQRTVLTQQRELKRLMNRRDLDVDSSTLVTIATNPNPVEYRFDANTLANSAEQNRMEMLELELRLLSDAVNIRYAQNQKLPQLDLTASYTVNGLGASSQDSFQQLSRKDYEDWSVGANLSVPLGNERANALMRQAVLTRLQRLSSKDARRQTVRQEVLNAIDRIQSGWQSILAARQATILATRALAAEQHQFDVGRSTSTDVLDAATRLAADQLSEIQALTEYQFAQTDLAVATGTLLGASRVRWDSPDPDHPTQAPDDRGRTPNTIRAEPELKKLDPGPPQPPPVPLPARN
jgi:outer membrane protein TolC